MCIGRLPSLRNSIFEWAKGFYYIKICQFGKTSWFLILSFIITAIKLRTSTCAIACKFIIKINILYSSAGQYVPRGATRSLWVYAHDTLWPCKELAIGALCFFGSFQTSEICMEFSPLIINKNIIKKNTLNTRICSIRVYVINSLIQILKN